MRRRATWCSRPQDVSSGSARLLRGRRRSGRSERIPTEPECAAVVVTLEPSPCGTRNGSIFFQPQQKRQPCRNASCLKLTITRNYVILFVPTFHHAVGRIYRIITSTYRPRRRRALADRDRRQRGYHRYPS